MNTLIIGANSDIARALAIELAGKKITNLTLASRDLEHLKRLANDIQIRFNANVSTKYLDVTDFKSHNEFVDSLETIPDCIIYAAGHLGKQTEQQNSFAKALESINTNYVGAVSLIESLVKKMSGDSKKTIIGISSVAGERGRASNYIYGSAKAAFTSYLSGLRSRLHDKNIHVITVLPGFVKTKMTENLALPALLTASPEQVAKRIANAIDKRHNTVYVKPIWWFIMHIIRLMPEFIFKRINL